MSFPRFRYQNQLSIDAPSLMASTATPQTVGLPPLPMQPKPNAEQVMILQLIANHLHTDPDYKRRFLHNLLAVQGVTFFRQSAIQLDNHLGPGSISNIELQLSRDLTAQEKAYLHPFLNVQLDVVSSWFQDTGKCSERSCKESILIGRSHSGFGPSSSRQHCTRSRSGTLGLSFDLQIAKQKFSTRSSLWQPRTSPRPQAKIHLRRTLFRQNM